jgi:hypothetical protein
MKRAAKAGSTASQRGGSAKPLKQRKWKRSRAVKDAQIKPKRKSDIREVEEARALLEDQLHSLYWWVFNAFKMKGFIRAKALDELQGADANRKKGHSGQDADRAIPSSPK